MEIKIPAVGESVTEALVGRWLKQEGEQVAKDQPICEIETDKITLELNAEADGVLSIQVQAGTTVPVGTVIGSIDEGAEASQPAPEPEPESKQEPKPELKPEEGAEAPPMSPSVRKMIQEKGMRPEEIRGTGKGGRITVEDLVKAGTGDLKSGTGDRGPGTGQEEKPGTGIRDSGFGQEERPVEQPEGASRPLAESRETRTPLSPIRRRIAERLLAARQQTAMLTTFNEVDMTRVIGLKQRHKEDFRRRHGVSLGFMPFFIKACAQALAEFPALNSRIDGDDIVRPHYCDIGIAVSGDKGLVVPVLRDADKLTFPLMEQRIAEFVEKVKTNRLSIPDLEGGTFTITNGGVYGSLLSTPILNPPQSAVLGMHAIQERPVARDGQVVIRPMMYLALSYDHRIVDGREAVLFLKRVRELIEDPEEMLLE